MFISRKFVDTFTVNVNLGLTFSVFESLVSPVGGVGVDAGVAAAS